MSKRVTSRVGELAEPILEEMNLDLIDIEFQKEGSNWFLRVFIDKEGGVDIDDCGIVSEKLSKRLDEVDPIQQAYFLEVSSPGIERPLKNEKDIHWAVGKRVNLSTYEPIENMKIFEGTLTEFDGTALSVLEGKKTYQIPYDKVAKARIAVVF
ncbi:ribosome maturation factor RimP [Ammoniphilus oxalaticus]|uniref:Ribosome maturation factor RimP n=1 Tax=Ammoniphilus oxalaticus TaxID=66863 RepID=A0A419SJW0_9BACL|nr:ribosome maturation factor RimP [Ammoniphilus oxalaticus]RKD24267.1 ribosome maturation factor RimP [Ammoniphilus oxalaticus]